MKKSKKKAKKLRKLIFFIIILICSIAGVSYARYNKKLKNNNLYSAENFYFESDLLEEETTPEYDFSDNETEISINLSNNADNLRYSDSDISYKVTITDSEGNEVSNAQEGTLAGGEISSNTVKFSNLASGTYLVTAKSLSPFTKTLTGKFVIKTSSSDISYVVSDAEDSTNLNLTLTTNSYSGKLKIEFPEEIEINNLGNNFSELTSTSATLEVKANSEYNIQFFKTDISKKYTETDITITKSN